MRHITIAMMIPSAIISSGILGILREIKDIDFSIMELSDDLDADINLWAPSLLIIDPVAYNNEWCADFKNNNPASRIIGVVHSSLPSSVQKNLDDTFSIYDSADDIAQVIRKNVAFEEGDSKGKDLSPREKEVIVGIVRGLSNKEIASEMNVSVNTVMTHRRNIASKLHIHTPAGLTIYAIVSNLVKLEDVKEGVTNAKL